MEKAIYNFYDHTKGDTFLSRQLDFNLDLTGCVILMQFRKNYTSSTIAFEFKTADSTIEFIDALNGVISMKERILDVEVGNYLYDFQITFPSGEVRTYFHGSINILNEISR